MRPAFRASLAVRPPQREARSIISEELSTQPLDTVPKAVTVGQTRTHRYQAREIPSSSLATRVVVKVQKILDEWT